MFWTRPNGPHTFIALGKAMNENDSVPNIYMYIPTRTNIVTYIQGDPVKMTPSINHGDFIILKS